jgi:superfamily II DNA/RNA helicase
MSVQGSSADVGVKPEGENRTSFAQIDPPISPALLSALSNLSLCYPTQVQKQFIPLALNGKDILARSSTGSGKTLAYAIPILQSILENKFKRRTSTTTALATLTMAIILVPTRELSAQVTLAISNLGKGLGTENAIEVMNLAGSDSKRTRRKHIQAEQYADTRFLFLLYIFKQFHSINIYRTCQHTINHTAKLTWLFFSGPTHLDHTRPIHLTS